MTDKELAQEVLLKMYFHSLETRDAEIKQLREQVQTLMAQNDDLLEKLNILTASNMLKDSNIRGLEHDNEDLQRDLEYTQRKLPKEPEYAPSLGFIMRDGYNPER